jgi:hypothetical protein
MKRKCNLQNVYSVIGLIVTLGVALGSDFFMVSLTQRNTELVSPFFVLWAYILFGLLLAAAGLLLFWFMLNRAPRNIWAALVFLVIGLFIVTYPILYYTPVFGGLFYTWLPQLNNILISPRSFTFTAGGLIALTGLFSFILSRKKG